MKNLYCLTKNYQNKFTVLLLIINIITKKTICMEQNFRNSIQSLSENDYDIDFIKFSFSFKVIYMRMI